MVKAVSGAIEPATLRRKTFSGQGLELVVRSCFFLFMSRRHMLLVW